MGSLEAVPFDWGWAAAQTALVVEDADRAAMRLDQGALALERGDVMTATDRLLSVRQTCRNGRLGRHALLLLGALKLDPRNPFRNPSLAADFLVEVLELPEAFPWTRPLAASLYTLALEMGGDAPLNSPSDPRSDLRARALRFSTRPIDEPADCNTPARQTIEVSGAVALPELDFPTVPDQLQQLQAESERLREEVSRLRAERSHLRRELSRDRGALTRLREESTRKDEEIARLRTMISP